MKTYIAICQLNHTCGSWVTDSDADKAISRCQRLVQSDWAGVFDIHGREADINVYDITDHEQVFWDSRGVHPCKDETLCLKTHATRTVTLEVPRRKRRA